MNLTLVFRVVRYVSLVIILAVLETSAPADVITTGDVDPGGASTQPDPWAAGAQLYVGRSGPGTLNVDAGGVVTNARGYLGYDSAATGEATITGNGSLWDSSQRLYVGQSGSGSLGVEAGGRVTSMHGYLGYDSGGTGKATITDAGSAWDNSGRLRVGVSGSGTLDIQAGGLVTNTEGYLGYFPGSTGEVNVNTEGRWDNSVELFLGGDNLGAGGTGTLNVTNRGLVTVLGTTKLWSTATLNLDGGNLTTGSFDNSELGTLNFHDGTLTVNGVGGVFNPGSSSYSIDGNAAEDVPHLVIANTATTTLAGDLKVGESRQGFLTVESGGVVTNTEGKIGDQSGSTGAATITGTGSQWSNSGFLYVGNSGSGTLNVESGGVVTNARGYLGTGSDSTGVATITGTGSQWNNSGWLWVGNYGGGTLNVESGGVVANISAVIGSDSGVTGEATITGTDSQWNNSGLLWVGSSGGGTLNIENAGLVSNTTAYLGYGPGGTGEATITGTGSQWNNSGFLYVGNSGSGTLNVESGGVVTNTGGRIGDQSGSTGAATVTGSGSQWNNSGWLWVGNYGGGTLNVESGGVVANISAVIGSDSGVTGEATITGTDSQWNNSGFLRVGSSGSGMLNVTDGGVVANTAGYMGFYSGSTGAATITGSGSQWNNSGFLRVGYSGTGTLNVESGGVVTNTEGKIGDQSGSTGAATITGTGSQWSNSGFLYVGNSGSGTLNVESGGVVANTSGFIGYETDSTGVATVTGVGSQWNNSGSLYIGGNTFFGAGGTGTASVHNGGTLTVAGMTKIYAGSTLILDGGTVRTSTLRGEGGALQFNTGELNLTGPAGLAIYPSGPLGASVMVKSSQTLRVDNTTTIPTGGSLSVSDGTFSTSTLALNGGSFTAPDLSGINAFVFDSGELNVTGPAGLTIGPSAPLDGLALNVDDVLDVAHTLTIASGSTAEVNGAAFNVGGLVVQEAGTLAFSETGLYILGSTTDNTALTLAGTLVAGPANLSLIDADGVDLGSSTTLAGGTLTSSTGFALDGDDDISGHGRLFGDMNLGTNGAIVGSGTGLELFGHVSGSGTVSDTTIYGNVDVGNSTGALTLTDVVIGSDQTVVTLEMGGTDSSMHDTITLAGDTTLAGNLEVQLIDSFLPQVGDTFSLFSLEPSMDLQGDFNDILLPDLETGLWDTSGLLTSGNLLVISTIPNPCSWGGDASCNTDDLDALYAVFNTSVPPTDAQFDLNADNVIGEADLTEWLSLAAIANGHSSSYLRGDTDLDHDVDTVDLTGMIMNYTGATGSGTTWLTGDIDGDGDTDTVDLTTAIINFTGARNVAVAVPEPSSLLLLVLAVGCLAATRFRSCRREWP